MTSFRTTKSILTAQALRNHKSQKQLSNFITGDKKAANITIHGQTYKISKYTPGIKSKSKIKNKS